MGGQALQQGLVAGGQLAAVFRQVDEGAALGHAAFLHQGIQQQTPVGVVHAQASQAAQAGGVGADLVGGVLVVGGQGVQHGTAQVLPGGLANDEVTGQAAMRQGLQAGIEGCHAGQAKDLLPLAQVHAMFAGLQQARQAVAQRGALQGLQQLQALRGTAVAYRRAGIQHAATTDDALAGGITQDQPVAMPGGQGLWQHQLCQTRAARGQGVGVQHGHGGRAGGGAQVDVDAGAAADRPGLGMPQVQFHIQPVRDRGDAGLGQPVAPLQLVALDAGQIDGAALAGVGAVGTAVLGVQRAHAQLFRAIGQLLQHVAHLHAASMHGAGGHGAHAIQAEHTVNGQAETRLGRKGCGGLRRFCGSRGPNGAVGTMGFFGPVRTMRRIQPHRLGAQPLAQFSHAVTAGG